MRVLSSPSPSSSTHQQKNLQITRRSRERIGHPCRIERFDLYAVAEEIADLGKGNSRSMLRLKCIRCILRKGRNYIYGSRYAKLRVSSCHIHPHWTVRKCIISYAGLLHITFHSQSRTCVSQKHSTPQLSHIFIVYARVRASFRPRIIIIIFFRSDWTDRIGLLTASTFNHFTGQTSERYLQLREVSDKYFAGELFPIISTNIG